MRLNPRTLATADSPISTTYTLLDGYEARRPLLDLAQAAPQYPPPPSVVEHVTAVAADPHGADYTDIAGIPRLRQAFADELSRDYRGDVRAEHVTVTAGCNQAFCLVVSALADPGDEVVVTLPYYFDHDMWLRLNGIRPVYLDPGDGRAPRAADAEALLTDRTRAIVVVSPGNPSGVTVDPDAIAELAELADRHGIALVLDETYRSFRDDDGPAHRLYSDPGWPRSFVGLYSFSKELALPGYRVGAVVASAELGREVAKLLDCVAVCAPRIGQEAAWAGLTTADAWRRARREDVLRARREVEAAMAWRPGGFELLSAGGFFAWVRHPFTGRPTASVVEDLLRSHDVLVIPGTAFGPDDRRTLRVSVSNLPAGGARELADRLTAAGSCGTAEGR